MKNCYFFKIKLPALRPINYRNYLIISEICHFSTTTRRAFQSYAIGSLTGKMALLLFFSSMCISGTAQVYLTVDNTKVVMHNGVAKNADFPIVPTDEIRIVEVGTDGVLVFDMLITILAVNVDAATDATYNPTAQKFFLDPPNASLDDQVEFSISIVETGLSTPLLLDNFTQEFRDIDSPDGYSDCSEVVGTTHPHTINLGNYLEPGGFEGNNIGANGNPAGFSLYRLKKEVMGSANDWTAEINFHGDPETNLTFSLGSMTTVNYVIGVTGTAGPVVGRGFIVSHISFDVAAPLPVEWLSFTAEFRQGERMLNWTTASELNADYFEVERSWDRIAFAAIDKVAATGENGISEYSYSDNTPAPTASSHAYYRLRQIDMDGRYEYSQTVDLTLAEAQNLSLKTYPNPFTNGLTLEWEEQENASTVKVFNMQGQGIFEQQVSKSDQHRLELDTHEWPAGVYSIQVLGENQTGVTKMIKY